MQLIDQHAPRLGVAPLCRRPQRRARQLLPVEATRVHGRAPRALLAARALRTGAPGRARPAPYARFVDQRARRGLRDAARRRDRTCAPHARCTACSPPTRSPRAPRPATPPVLHPSPSSSPPAPTRSGSWDITKLRSPAKWTYFYLYVILDVFSRYVVGWMIAQRETAALAKKFIGETGDRQGITPASSRCTPTAGPP